MSGLINTGFERGWRDVSMIAQEPYGWRLVTLAPGQELFDSSEQVVTRPECVHKLAHQLPPDERPGAERALILDGGTCYKLFASGGAWGATLRQTATGLPAGAEYTIRVPFQFHDHEQTGDPWAAEIKVELNGAGDWTRIGDVGNSLQSHDWHEITNSVTVPESGEVRVAIFVKAKYGGIDLFLDAIRDEVTEAEKPPEPSEPSEWGFQVIERGSKLGVHGIFSNSIPSFCDTLVREGTQFPVVKAVDDLSWLPEIKAAHPDVITIGRFTSPYEGCGELDNPDADVEVMADALLNVITSKAYPEAMEAVDYWEVVNEPDPPGPDGYARLGELMKACMWIAEASRLKLALFSFNSGTPEYDEMEALVETSVFGRAKRGGHILALHEGAFGRDQDPRTGWGEGIGNGSPELDAGSLNCRYRYLYHLLKERDEVIPLVVSEWYAGNETETPTEQLVQAAEWYDSELRKDYYAWSFCPFTLGPTDAWLHTDWEQAYGPLLSHVVNTKNASNSLPPEFEPEPPEDGGQPREQYRRVYNYFHPSLTDEQATRAFRYQWREGRETAGGSADDVGVGDLDERHGRLWGVPEEARPAYRDFYAGFYPGVTYEFRDIAELPPWHRDISESLPRNDDCPPPLDDGWWQRTLEQIDGITIHHTLSHSPHETAKHYLHKGDGRPSIPYAIWVTETGEIVKCLGLTEGCWHDHTGHENTHLSIALAGDREAREPTAPQLESLLRVVQWAMEKLNVSFEKVKGHQDYTSTACPGWHSGWRLDFYKRLSDRLGVEEPQKPLLLGLHDEAGADWMVQQDMPGVALVHTIVQRKVRTLDFSHLQDAGIKVICRLNWGYADGTGTLPPPEHKMSFVRAVTDTMAASRGIDLYHVGNEPNNRSEWPRDFMLTPDYVVDIYNGIWLDMDAGVRMGPPPLDPYFGPGSDNSLWWMEILERIDGADALFLHAKTQTNDPADVRSRAKFSDDPLRWQYLNLGVIETYLDMVPQRFRDLPVYVTELNPQHLTESGGAVGWQDGNAEWVREAVSYLRDLRGAGAPIAGACFYRYLAAGDQAPFGLENKPRILEAIVSETA